MDLLRAIHEKRDELERRSPYRDEPLCWIILTPEQVRKIQMGDRYNYITYSMQQEFLGGTVRFMGMPLHIAPKGLDMSGWLFYNSCIDVRNYDGN